MSLQRGVGVLGASSLVGLRLLPLLADAGWQVLAYARSEGGATVPGVTWRRLALEPPKRVTGEVPVPFWICVAPIWVLPDYFSMLESAGAQRVVVLSSTSRFTKVGADNTAENTVTSGAERAIAARLIGLPC